MLEKLLSEYDNDIIKVLKYLYDEVPATKPNSVEVQMTDRSEVPKGMCTPSLTLPIASRKRKYGDMCCDSPQSDKCVDIDEDDKASQENEFEEVTADSYAKYLVNSLKRISTEESAAMLIKNSLKSFKQE